MNTTKLFLLGIVLSLLLIYAFFGEDAPSVKHLSKRKVKKDVWRNNYSSKEMTTVNKLLDIIEFSYLLEKNEIYRLRPEDKLSALSKGAIIQGENENETETCFEAFQNIAEGQFSLTARNIIINEENTIGSIIGKLLKSA